MRHDKLVRDLIPVRLARQGVVHRTRTLDDDAYVEALRAKLLEEVEEYLAARATGGDELDELADIAEVVHALAGLAGATPDDLEALRRRKADERGAFEQRIFLIDTD